MRTSVGSYLTIAIATVSQTFTVPRQFVSNSEIQIVIVYNGRDEGFRFLSESHSAWPHVVVLQSQPFNLSQARNRAVLESKTQWILFVDDDARPCPNFTALAKALISRIPENMVLVGGKVLLESSQHIPPGLRPLLSELDLGNDFLVLEDGFVNGALLFVRRSFLDACGGFNPSLGRQNGTLLSGEDSELIYKARDKGLLLGYFGGISVTQVVPDERLRNSFVRKRLVWEEVTQAAIRSSLAYETKSKSTKASSISILWYRLLAKFFRILLT